MSTLALQCCPKCRRNVAPQALVCRACYTVLPRRREVEPVSTPPRRVLAGPAWVGLVVIVGIGLWWARVDLGLLSSEGSDVGGPLAGGGFLLPSGASSSEADNSSSAPVTHWSIMRESDSCIIRQGVRNVGSIAATHATYLVSFLDADENVLEDATVEAPTTLAVGQQGNVKLAAPCPRSTVGAEVAISKALSETSFQPELELLGKSEPTYRRRANSRISTVVADVPDLTICPLPAKCALSVAFEAGREATYHFKRDAKSPELLTNDNSILVGHLQGRRSATLHLGDEVNGTTISLSYKNVHVQEPPSFLSRLGDLLPWRSGDKS